MARGNDPDAARELQEKYGTTGTAEDLINANRARRDRVVVAASRSPIDAEATEKLKLSDVSHEGDGKVVDAAVRGRYVSYVWEDSQGRLHHGAHKRKGLSKAEAELADERVGEDTAEESVARAHAEHAAELERVRREFEARLEEAVAKARKDATADAQKSFAESQRKVSDAAADAS